MGAAQHYQGRCFCPKKIYERMENLLNYPYARKPLTEKMHHFCSAPLFGSFLIPQPIPVSAYYKHLANTSSSPLLPSFSSQNATPLLKAEGFPH